MRIAGLQKMTLLDYPGNVACTVFLQGCNFRCPFCHNSGLLSGEGPDELSEAEFFSFLESRRGLLDAVCVSGGEPTLQPELPGFLGRIKAMGYRVKLDTNGSRPDVLKALAEGSLLDYVAMDVKNSPCHYGRTVGIPAYDTKKIEESIRFLLTGAVDYELRTTVVDALHSDDSILRMGQWLRSLSPEKLVKRLYLQRFVQRDSVLLPGLNPPAEEDLARFVRILQPFVHQVEIRGE